MNMEEVREPFRSLTVKAQKVMGKYAWGHRDPVLNPYHAKMPRQQQSLTKDAVGKLIYCPEDSGNWEN